MKIHREIRIALISAVIGAVVATGSNLAIQHLQKPKPNDLIKEFYQVENAVHVSPHGLRKRMDKGDDNFILVDLRSQEEYEKEHIVSAINIPAYKDPDTSAYGDVERIVGEFFKLSKNKEVIIYCYSIPCMTGRKIGKMLAENGIYVKHLGVGWNEWRYFWNLWNHDTEAPTQPEDYVVSGKEPGIPEKRELPSPCGEGGFSC